MFVCILARSSGLHSYRDVGTFRFRVIFLMLLLLLGYMYDLHCVFAIANHSSLGMEKSSAGSVSNDQAIPFRFVLFADWFAIWRTYATGELAPQKVLVSNVLFSRAAFN